MAESDNFLFKTPLQMFFFVNQKVGNRAPLYTYSFDPMLFQICLSTATLIKFTQNSDLNKSVQEILT